jgi:hypothetical protein
LANFNLNPAVTTQPLYYNIAYNGYSTIVYSYQANALSVGSIAVQPPSGVCMNPQIQTSNYFYALELM